MGNFDEAFACVGRLRARVAGEQLAEVEAKQRDLQEQERQVTVAAGAGCFGWRVSGGQPA